jgi:hypothetical protein
LRSFDEKPFVTKNRPKPIRWIKEFSLKKRIRRDRRTYRRLLFGEVRKPSRRLRFSSLISYDVKQLEPKLLDPFSGPWPRPEVAAYMGRRIARQHSFLRLLQFPV